MTFGEACRELRKQKCTNLWSLDLWDRKPPVTMDDDYIARNETRLAALGDWEVNGRHLVFVRKSDGVRMRIYSAA